MYYFRVMRIFSITNLIAERYSKETFRNIYDQTNLKCLILFLWSLRVLFFFCLPRALEMLFIHITLGWVLIPNCLIHHYHWSKSSQNVHLIEEQYLLIVHFYICFGKFGVWYKIYADPLRVSGFINSIKRKCSIIFVVFHVTTGRVCHEVTKVWGRYPCGLQSSESSTIGKGCHSCKHVSYNCPAKNPY